MNLLLPILVTSLVASACVGPRSYPMPGPPDAAALSGAPAGYRLVWSDDFTGTALDTTRWHYRTDVKLQSAQRPENVRVEKGHAVLGMKKERFGGLEHTGAGIISKERFRYGYFEARVRMHGGSGWHQSFWGMYGDGSDTYTLQRRTEIDAMEFDSDTPTYGHTGIISWLPEPSNPTGGGRSVSCSIGYQYPLGFDATTDFHVYAWEWTNREVKFFLDRELRCVLAYPAEEFEHDPINIWLTTLGHEKLAGPIDDAALPGYMLVDYVRVYRRK